MRVMRSKIAWLAYVVLGALHKLFRPQRLVRFNGGLIYFGRNAVWYAGPDDKPRRISEPDA